MTDFSFSSTAEDVTQGLSLEGKTFAITGVNSGLGKESARVLSKRGAYIIGLARSEEKAAAALEEIGAEGAAIACELSDIKSAKSAGESIVDLGRSVDAVLCNAGIMALPERQTQDGVEMQLLTNHVGHFALTNALLPALNESGRVIVTSSAAYRMAPEEGIDFSDISGEKTYDAWRQYGQSKLANILFARQLNKNFEGQRKAAALHPGVIRTNLGRNSQADVENMLSKMDPAQIKSAAQGAATQCLLATSQSLGDFGGQYWADCQPAKIKGPALDDELAKKLWTWTEELVAKH